MEEGNLCQNRKSLQKEAPLSYYGVLLLYLASIAKKSTEVEVKRGVNLYLLSSKCRY